MKYLLILMFFFVQIAHAKIKVIDGDSLKIDDKEIRLIGIDSPEYFQLCKDKDNQDYECGYQAYQYLKLLIDSGIKNGKKLKCRKKDTDKYHRELSECFIGKKNLNRAMVKSGNAISYWSEKYKKSENKARKNKKGIWQGRFMRPELYRILKKYKKE